MRYLVYYGKTVPFAREVLTTWVDACKFMKAKLDLGIPVHSVSKEAIDATDE